MKSEITAPQMGAIVENWGAAPPFGADMTLIRAGSD